MTSASMRESALYIERLCNRYVVANRAPEEFRARCEGALATTLSDALAVALGPVLPDGDPDLWFIRQLDVEFSVNPEIEHARVAELWAQEISRALVDAFHSDDPGILHFPDRASYLAHFVLDVAAGTAWDRWYYAGFDGLRMLSTSSALRTALCDVPETGLHALRLLTEDQRRTILRTVSIADARRILAAFASNPIGGTVAEYVSLLIESWSAVLGFQSHDEDRRALALFIAVAQQHPDRAGERLRAIVAAVCRLARQMHECDSHELEILSAVRAGNLSALYAVLGSAAEPIASLLPCPAETLEPLLQLLGGEPVVDSKTQRETRFTAFGGAFLLFPILDEFPFHIATASWSDLESVSAAAILRLLILAKCFGRDRFMGCLRDPLIRDLLQIPGAISASAIAEWLGAVSSDQHLSLLRANIAFHLDTGALEAETFLYTTVAHKGPPIALLLDDAHGLWLFASKLTTRRRTVSISQLGVPRPARLFCHASLWQDGQEYFPEAELLPIPPVDARSSPLAVARDLRYLEIPRALSVPKAIDLTLSVVAQGVLRRFARKLPGFAKSSLDYLNHNFLDVSAAVEETEERRVVSLSRSPLHLVLAMAGLSRCTYRLNWLDGRPCAIFPEG
jgi:hypothetical protein